MDCRLPGFSVHGIFQTRVLEWVAISFSRRSSQPRDWTRVSRIVGRCFTIWATREELPKSPNYCFDLCDIEKAFDQSHKTWEWAASLRLNISMSGFSCVQQSTLEPKVISGFFFIRVKSDMSSSHSCGGLNSCVGLRAITAGLTLNPPRGSLA